MKMKKKKKKKKKGVFSSGFSMELKTTRKAKKGFMLLMACV